MDVPAHICSICGSFDGGPTAGPRCCGTAMTPVADAGVREVRRMSAPERVMWLRRREGFIAGREAVDRARGAVEREEAAVRQEERSAAPSPAGPSHEVVAAYIDRIEAEMRRVGLWQATPIEPERMNFSAAFAMDTMAFSQWLQFVFLPRVRQIVADRGAFPSSSMVAAQAVREFDGVHEAAGLVALLAEFDALF